MKTRKTYIGENRKAAVVWFGSRGINPDGTAIFADKNKANFDDKAQGITNAIVQKLNLIKGELWYDTTFGLPLTDKENTALSLDAEVARIVLNTEGVKNIISLESEITPKHTYKANIKIETIFGEILIFV